MTVLAHNQPAAAAKDRFWASARLIADLPKGAMLRVMSDDLRNSLKLWASVAFFVGFGVLAAAILRAFINEPQLDSAFNSVPAWMLVLAGVWSLLSLARIGWGLWRRRARNAG